MYGALSEDGKHLFRQDDKFDTKSFIAYMEKVENKFIEFIEFFDRATQIRSEMVEEYFQQNLEKINIEYFLRVQCSSILLKKCWRQCKGNTPSNYYSSFSQVKQAISNYYSTRRFELDVK